MRADLSGHSRTNKRHWLLQVNHGLMDSFGTEKPVEVGQWTHYVH